MFFFGFKFNKKYKVNNMSTKIYSGYKLPTTNLYEINAFARPFIVKYREKLLNHLNTKITNREELIEFYKLFRESEEKSYNSFYQKTTYYGMSLVFFPLKKYTLFMHFGDWEENWKEEYYGYWDNVDPDEDCSEEQWELRKQDWNKTLLNKTGIPNVEGFVKEITSSEDVLKYYYSKIVDKNFK